MGRIFLLFESSQNYPLLTEWLAVDHEILQVQQAHELADPFDLCLIDRPLLDRYGSVIETRKQALLPIYLPVLLVTPHQELPLVSSRIWKQFDEVLTTPIEQIELRARVELLLRARAASLQLDLHNQNLTTFIQAMAHDLRSPLHVIMSTAQLLIEEQFAVLDTQGQRDIECILANSRKMERFISALQEYARLGRSVIDRQPIALCTIVGSCLHDLHEIIRARGATIAVAEELPVVLADPQILKTILLNILSNALHYVAPTVCPVVTISTCAVAHRLRIQVQDNGIGIAPDHHDQIFLPFMRLRTINHPGHGLGLATVQKAVELLGWRIGVQSALGEGSLFWIELDNDQV